MKSAPPTERAAHTPRRWGFALGKRVGRRWICKDRTLDFVTVARVAVSSLLVVSIALGMLGGSVESMYHAVLGGLWIAAIPLWTFATEREELPPDVSVPEAMWKAVVLAPWLPGGGRGTLLVLVHLCVAFLAVWCAGIACGEVGLRVDQMGIACSFAAAWVCWPIALASCLPDWPGKRAALHVTVPVAMAVVFFLTMYWGDLDHHGWRTLAGEVLNPWNFGNLITSRGHYVGHPAAAPIVLSTTVIGILANVPRMGRSVREIVERNRFVAGES